MRTKKKAVVISLCAIILIAATVIGTLAYLTDREKAVNTFTMGNVDITLDETKVTPDGKPVDGADRVKENNYHLIPGQTYTKDPTVTVVKDSEEAYVRMLVIVNELADLDAIFAPTGADLTSIFGGYDSQKWIYEGETEADDKITYEFRYYKTVDASDATENIVLEPLFTNIIVPGEITGEQLDTIKGLQIDVMGHAIQKSGFDTADAAWAAFEKQYSK